MSLDEARARIDARARDERTKKAERLAEVRLEYPEDAARLDYWRTFPRFVEDGKKLKLSWLRVISTGEEWGKR